MRTPLKNIIVLKFGSSVLQSAADLPQAVHEIYRWLRLQYSVVAVVSAFAGDTDRLLQQAQRFGKLSNQNAVARLISTGEEQSSSLLALELDRFGVPATVLDATQIELRAEGDACDAIPTFCATQPILDAAAAGKVVIVPGYAGRNAAGEVVLLGRGGSDLSAILLAQQLDARCRIIKDVEGIYPSDPRIYSNARCYREVNWAEAGRVGAQIVQPKALAFAQAAEFEFEVAQAGSDHATRVGSLQTQYRDGNSNSNSNEQQPAPLRVGLLGLGTVGLGVFRELWRRPDLFEVPGIAVRSPRKHQAHAPHHLLTTDGWRVVEESDLIIEVMGGITPALDLISAALCAGKQVVTASKLLLATAGERWRSFSQSGTLRISAAVGGALPVLETISELRASGRRIEQISGVLNGTCNFVLDRIAAGSAFNDAVRDAQEAGFAEADPTLDLDGTDTACELQLIAREAFGISLALAQIPRNGIEAIDCAWVRSVASSGNRVRLVGRLWREHGTIFARVAPLTVAGDCTEGVIREEQNTVTVTAEGFTKTIWGRGAGRWPTTVSVMGDVFEIARQASRRRLPLQVAAGGAA
ncbi:MAG: homoserine dehydrogenase [Acidobacteriaceae bacterium]